MENEEVFFGLDAFRRRAARRVDKIFSSVIEAVVIDMLRALSVNKDMQVSRLGHILDLAGMEGISTCS